jgi:hypothetical protein
MQPEPTDFAAPHASQPSALTVVLATRDRSELLESALAALSGAIRPIDEILVVDSASQDKERVRALAARAGTRFLRCDAPGACRARNAGWRAARNELVAFIDDDCLPRPGWGAAMVSALCRPERPDFVTGRVVAGAPREQRGQLALSLTERDEPATFEADGDIATMGHGANMGWRQDALEAIKGFDEALGPGAPLRAAEDHDAFWRVLRRGGMGIFDPAVVVEHSQWRNRRAQLRAYYGYGVGSGALAAKRRRLGSDGDREAAPLGPRAVARLVAGLAWREGLLAVGRSVADHYEMGALAESVKFAGSLEGVARSWRRELVAGHYRTAVAMGSAGATHC